MRASKLPNERFLCWSNATTQEIGSSTVAVHIYNDTSYVRVRFISVIPDRSHDCQMANRKSKWHDEFLVAIKKLYVWIATCENKKNEHSIQIRINESLHLKRCRK